MRRIKGRKTVGTIVVGLMLWGLSASLHAGTFTTALLGGDADSGISSTKTYTHAVNIAAPAPATINGVTFSPGGAGANATLQYNLNGTFTTMNNFTGADANIAGDSENLFHDFFYNDDNFTLTLDGLVAGQSYRAVFYAVGWGNPGGRYNTVSDGLGGSILYDQNFSSDRQGNMLIADYTAAGSSVTFTIAQNTADSNPGLPNTTGSIDRYHLYAFSNEAVVPEPTALALLASASLLFLRRRPA